jgi:uncharacterized protein
MLVLEVSKVPAEGIDVDEELRVGEVHVEGEETFALEGGRLVCRVERGDDQTVHVRGHLEARLGLECGRCLAPYPFAVDQELDLFYLPHRGDQEEEDEVELSDRDMVVAYHRDDRLDLGEMVREQFFLSVPLKRLCREDCSGLCASCGCNRNLTRCSCPPPPPDPRLAPLANVFNKGSA